MPVGVVGVVGVPGGMVGSVGTLGEVGVVDVVGAVLLVGGVDADRPATPIGMLDGFAAPATLPGNAGLIMLDAGCAAAPAEFERVVLPAPDAASLPEHAATNNAPPIIHVRPRTRTRSTFRYSMFEPPLNQTAAAHDNGSRPGFALTLNFEALTNQVTWQKNAG